MLSFPLIASVFSTLALALQPSGAPAGKGATPPATTEVAPAQPATPPAAPSSADPKVAELLERLERANAGLRTATADIRYIKVFPEVEGGDKHVRTGTLVFAQTLTPELAPQLVPPPAGQPARRGFVVDLRQLLIDNGTGKPVLNERPRTWVFDGTWLLEKRDEGAQKQFTKTRIVGPGSTRDPLRIGEGPLPLPIGQRPSDMLRTFDLSVMTGDAELPENTDAKLRELLKPCTQLKLIPRPGTRQARNFSEIRIWYRTTDSLPVFARAVGTTGSKDEVLLSNMRLNAEVPKGAFDTATPGPPWQGQVNELRASDEGGAPGPEADKKPAK